MFEIECAVESVGKEVKQRDAADAHRVHVVGPINEQATPDHDRQHGDVDPVHPANRSWVFEFQAVHPVDPPRSRPLSRAGTAPRFCCCYFLSPCILSPCIFSPPILSPPILSPCILSPCIVAPCILSLPVVVDEP